MNLMAFLKELREAEIYFELASNRDDGVSVIITVPGERWEVDFLEDGSVDVERFVSNGEIRNEEALKELFARFDERLSGNRHNDVERQMEALNNPEGGGISMF